MILLADVIAVLIVLLTTYLIIAVIKKRNFQIEESTPPVGPRPNDEMIKTLYSATTSLYIEVDREVWQIATIFSAASLGVMGWVIINFDKLNIHLVNLLGAASISLVGFATLFKYRLREFNLVHIAYLRKLEYIMTENQSSAEYWGLHYIRRSNLKSNGKIFDKRSIHGLMNIYYFLFLFLWIALVVVKFSTPLKVVFTI